MPRVNFTGRARIPRHLIDCKIYNESTGSEALVVNCTADLEDYAFPEESGVFLEAYLRARAERIQLEFDGKLATVAEHKLELFLAEDPVLFRLKVAAQSEEVKGLLLGVADQIRPESSIDADSQRRKSLLPVRSESMGQEIWKLSLEEDGDRPVLLINRELTARTISKDKVFSSILYPDILRRILFQVLVVDDLSDPDDLTDWQDEWVKFAMRIPGVRALQQGSDRQSRLEWIDLCARAFAGHIGCLRTYQDSDEPA